MLNAAQMVPTHDIALVTLDTLRYDVAQEAWAAGETPGLAAYLGLDGWERRHSPGTFTYSAHHAFFAGFLPTPVSGPGAERLFALRFPRSQTTGENTCVLDGPSIVHGLAEKGYHTVCIGGVGFFNKATALGEVLPGYFAESHWRLDFGPGQPHSTELQVELARRILEETPSSRRVFLFLNVSALHPPNRIFLDGSDLPDDPSTQRAALRYVDRHLPPLFEALQRRGPWMGVICSDHGTAYGEDGYRGHRLSHPVVLDVPYAEFARPGLVT